MVPKIRSKNFLFFLSSLIVVFVVLAVAFYFLSARIAGSDWARIKIVSALSAALGGEVAYQKLELNWLPRPSLALQQVTVSRPDSTARITKLIVSPEISPLLRGDLKIENIRLEQPDIQVALPETTPTSFNPGEIEKKLIPVFTIVRQYAPGLHVDARKGTFRLLKGGGEEGRTWVFQNVDVQLALSGTLELSLRCGSSPWGPLSFKGRFSHRDGMLDADRIQGNVGRNSIAKASALLSWTKTVRLKAKSGRLVVVLDDLESWTGDFMSRLAPPLKKIGGTVLFASAAFDGPLENLSAAQYNADGSLENVVVQTDGWAAPVRIPTAVFRLDQDSLSFQKADILTLDSTVKLAGSLRSRERTIEALHASGKIGRKTIRDLTNRVTVLRGAVFPTELALDGSFSFRPGMFGIQKLNISTGRTSVSNLTARLELSGRDYLRADADRVVFNPQEFGEWGFRIFKRVFPDLKSISGLFTFTSARFEGALRKAEGWRYSTSGAIQNAMADVDGLPGPVRVPAASFTADQDLLTVQNVSAGLLDSDVVASGLVRVEGGKVSSAELQISGKFGGQSVQWAAAQFKLPQEVVLPRVLAVNGGTLSWKNPDRFSLAGSLDWQGFDQQKNLMISFKLDRSPEALKIQRVSLKDNLSNAVFSLDYRKNRIAGFTFSGTLHKQTLDALYRIDQPGDGWISGNMNGRISMAQPAMITAKGALKAANIRIPLGGKSSLQIDNLDLTAEQDRFLIQSANLAWQNQFFSLQGAARASPGRFHVDADVRTGKIDLDELIGSFKGSGTKHSGQPFGWVTDLPIEGTVRVKADRLIRRTLTLEPCAAEVSLGPGRIRIFVEKALLCGIPVPAAVQINPGGIYFTLRSAMNQALIAPVLKCLAGERMGITGVAAFRTELEGTEKIPGSLWGDGELTIRDGRIYRFNLLSRILDFLNITQIVLGQLPDFSRKGMAYDVIRIRYRVDGSKLILSRIQLRGDTLSIAGDGTIDLAKNTMNLTLLVSPLRTVDKILSRIPIIRQFRSILAIPVSVYGDLNNPVIVPLSPAAIGSHLFDLMKEALELPFSIIEPLTK